MQEQLESVVRKVTRKVPLVSAFVLVAIVGVTACGGGDGESEPVEGTVVSVRVAMGFDAVNHR